ncbi:sigma factor-like helix-turn-helix DNA-binding protein [Lentzea sp. DG1S-22]|uniref:sigma factor-like helix-turn-helix DNA-binding protein n=1 Tax=Lentzea sp. DG1S-22 TaxID=3108822 RepID=UPI002E769D61|nr:sigma factor-like helix-turn-helix DNA-binding protein [Lentzea sp. DG1S-22]WVH82308.1 sigma factor-like helix-turn-helix DNA-binding protein [Lentzea sp. DG1S-22]
MRRELMDGPGLLLERLPALKREILLLGVVFGLSARETAETHGINAGSSPRDAASCAQHSPRTLARDASSRESARAQANAAPACGHAYSMSTNCVTNLADSLRNALKASDVDSSS